MKITVIIRSMGRPSLDRATASVRQQDLPDVQVLIVDAKTRGLRRAQAAQTGLDEARTQWALFLDDDDELLPGHLAKLAAALQAHPQAIAAYTGVEQIREGSREQLAVWDRAFEPWQLLAANALPIHAVLFDRERLCAQGVRFDESFDTFEDWDFWLQVQSAGAMVYAPGVSARYWVAESGQSAAQFAHHGDNRYEAIWRKWWILAPPAWWHHMWRAARDEPTWRLQWGLAEEARLQAEAARVQAEAARVQAEDSLDHARNALNRQELELTELHALNRARQLELSRLEVKSKDLSDRLALESEQSRLALSQRDQARMGEQGARVHLEAVLSSRSWRLTAPLRWIGRQARRVLQLRSADARRHWWWRLRHRSFPRPALLSTVLPDPYHRWLAVCGGGSTAERDQAHAEIVQMAENHAAAGQPMPLISVLMPVFNPPLRFWDEAIESLRLQWYPHWELCVADDASTDPQVAARLQAWASGDSRIRFVSLPKNGHISAASNAALHLAQGDWVALLDQDDLLAPQALWHVVQAIQQYPDAGLIYSDEDKIDKDGRRFGPYFKPAFDLDLLRGQNMISHLGVYRRSLLQAAGGFRVGYEGSQDHDLALRCIEQLQEHQVVHIPRVLYHWRVHQDSTSSGQAAKPYALDAGLRAVQDHLARCNLPGHVGPHPAVPHHVVTHLPPSGSPDVWSLRVVLWGHPEVARPLTPLTSLLASRGCSVKTAVDAPSWLEACVLLKAWASSGLTGAVLLVGGDVDWDAMVLRSPPASGLWDEGLPSIVAHLAESGVGALGWAVRDRGGGLHDAGWVLQENGSARPIARAAGSDTHGYFGQLCLAHRASALSGHAVLVRLEALNADSAGLVLRPGWRAVWSPQMVWPGRPVHSGNSQQHDWTTAPLILETLDWRTGTADPAFSPHLCAEHADHRLAPTGERSPGPQAPMQFRARARVFRSS